MLLLGKNDRLAGISILARGNRQSRSRHGYERLPGSAFPASYLINAGHDSLPRFLLAASIDPGENSSMR